MIRLTTRTGSIYELRVMGGQWWLKGTNVENAYSKPMGDEWWEIDPPYPMPILIGYRLILTSKYANEEKDHPLRIDGGGKVTSEIIDIQDIPV